MTNDADLRIVAVVVTYNRLPLVRRLVERLVQVPLVDEVLVIDNASRDGTGDWLASTWCARRARRSRAAPWPAGWPPRSGRPVRRWCCTGRCRPTAAARAASTTGLAWAVERGADLVWLMDDDGLPEPDCLGSACSSATDLDFWGPAVVAEDDPSRLVFPIRLPGGTRRSCTSWPRSRRPRTDGLIRDVVIPFNGVLVTRELVDRIGLPREEFFIWGDDVEYLWRAQRGRRPDAPRSSARRCATRPPTTSARR